MLKCMGNVFEGISLKKKVRMKVWVGVILKGFPCNLPQVLLDARHKP